MVTVNKSSWDNRIPLMCTARNAVSSRSVTVTISGLLCPGIPSDSGIWIGVIVGVAVMVVILLVLLVFLWKSKGYCPDCMARLARGSTEISATAGPGDQGCVQAMSSLGPEPGPEPGPASDQHGPGLGQTSSVPEQITDQLRPEPGPAVDQFRPGLGQTSSTPAQITDQLRPLLGPAMGQHDHRWVWSCTRSLQCLDWPRTISDQCLHQEKPKLDISRKLSMERMIKYQNSVPGEVAEPPSLDVFNKRLDVALDAMT
ncbi:hypothetical protein HGM15179_021518 [Zosterops borbonicus]|uniref:Uncharacterized protein n=1 Tax=Zosterops borbonicus TaxID=364589 RepID=A0A8K1D6M9_9PASS|nr:hypothetical protein HGM15179_021518 [Zosterops borbonicus]